MSIYASGAAFARPIDPTTDTHYALSEEAEFGLRNLSCALTALAEMTEVPEDETGRCLYSQNTAALFHVLADYSGALIASASARPRFPLAKRGVK